MAKNIVSTLEARENEIQGLLSWSLAPVRAIAVLSLLLGLQQIFLLVVAVFGENNAALSVWTLAEGLSFFLVAYHSLWFSQFAQKYSDREDELVLGKAMLCLGGFWLAYAMALCFSAIPYLLYIWGQGLSSLITFAQTGLGWFLIPALALALYFKVMQKEGKLPFAVSPFTSHIPSFAKLNVAWTRFTAFLGLAAGFLLLFLYATDRLTGSLLDTVATPISGLCFLVIGAALALLWRAVREIHRNPTIIYFERTMERLNLFWLVACVGFGVIFIGRFF